jgi:hypothetical protein
MNGHGGLGRVAVLLLVAAVCAQFLADVLPRLVVPLTVVAVLVIALRLVLFHTRRW